MGRNRGRSSGVSLILDKNEMEEGRIDDLEITVWKGLYTLDGNKVKRGNPRNIQEISLVSLDPHNKVIIHSHPDRAKMRNWKVRKIYRLLLQKLGGGRLNCKPRDMVA